MNRKRVLHLLAALLMLALIAPMAPAGRAAAGSQPTIVYLGLGDSLAEGYGATDPAQLGYVPRLYGFFHGVPHGNVNSFTNLGLGGETSSSFISGGQLASALQIIGDPESSVGIVTLDIGSNDLLGLLGSEPCRSDPGGIPCQMAAMALIGTFYGNYATILTALTNQLAADTGDAKLLIMTYYNPWNGSIGPMADAVDAVLFGADGVIDCPANVNQLNVGLNDVIACVGQAFGATIVNGYDPFVGTATQLTHIADTPSDMHPNNAGYARLAQAFERAYRDAYR